MKLMGLRLMVPFYRWRDWYFKRKIVVILRHHGIIHIHIYGLSSCVICKCFIYMHTWNLNRKSLSSCQALCIISFCWNLFASQQGRQYHVYLKDWKTEAQMLGICPRSQSQADPHLQIHTYLKAVGTIGYIFFSKINQFLERLKRLGRAILFI